MASNLMADSPVQWEWLQMASNPMADSPEQSEWLQSARNPMADSPEQSAWLLVAVGWPLPATNHWAVYLMLLGLSMLAGTTGLST